ncbi:MinD/ParA family protein [Labedella phragmitis]|uniref:MinD/ParA family protein n=2 Tax=Labedella phragmitis TaxID=2498849 RepID=A0A444PVY5_9MICO|nr:MinD/ParA family protein [Labedella phragmitis]
MPVVVATVDPTPTGPAVRPSAPSADRTSLVAGPVSTEPVDETPAGAGSDVDEPTIAKPVAQKGGPRTPTASTPAARKTRASSSTSSRKPASQKPATKTPESQRPAPQGSASAAPSQKPTPSTGKERASATSGSRTAASTNTTAVASSGAEQAPTGSTAREKNSARTTTPRKKPAAKRTPPVTRPGTAAKPKSETGAVPTIDAEPPVAIGGASGEDTLTGGAPRPDVPEGAAAEPRLTLADPAVVVDLPPAEQQEVPEEELAVAIEEAPVTPERLEPRTSSVPVIAEPVPAAERDESIEEPQGAPAFTGMSVARALAGAPESSSMLTAERLLDDRRDTRRVPEGFWQKLLYDVSGHRIRAKDSRAARERNALTARIAKPLSGSARFVPVLTRKGGVGKTTVTTLLGMALADARDDRVIAIDANPDRGTLAERIARRNDHTVRDLVRTASAVTGYTEFSNLVSRDATRLDVLASDTDPHLSQAFDEDDYDIVARLASQYYSIVLTDCGTGIVHSVMGATLRHADSLVIVSGTSVDEARSAAETVSWLEANGYPELAASAVVVINSTAPGTPAVRLDEIEKHFESRVRSIVRVPFDPQLATGAAISFADLRPDTRKAARELSALVVEGLPARRSTREPADG